MSSLVIIITHYSLVVQQLKEKKYYCFDFSKLINKYILSLLAKDVLRTYYKLFIKGLLVLHYY